MLTSILGGLWLQTRPPEIASSSYSRSGLVSICLDSISCLLVMRRSDPLRPIAQARFTLATCREVNHGLRFASAIPDRVMIVTVISNRRSYGCVMTSDNALHIILNRW